MHHSRETDMPAQDEASRFNQWTLPWSAPEGPEMDAIRAGTHRAARFEIRDEQIETFQRDGVVLLRGAFTGWVERLRRGLGRCLADPGAYRFPCESTRPGEPGRFFDNYCNWPLIPEYRDFVFRSGAASLAGQAMRSRVAQLFHDHAFVKEPGTRRATPFHQDLPYYCVSGDQSASVYVALDDVEEEVAVQYVRGSHRWPALYRPKVFLDGEEFNAEDPALRSIPDLLARRDEHDIACWPLGAGDAVLFNFRTVHGTSGALVRARRRAFSTRWLGDDVRYAERPGETSPPYTGIGLETGDRMREDWFPVIWRRDA